MVRCEHCGTLNPETANFCGQCGQPLRELSEGSETATIGVTPEMDDPSSLDSDDAAAIAALPAGSALLIVLRGPGLGSRYLLDTDLVTVGRHPDSDIFLDDITVSRRHVEFRRDVNGGLGYSVHDVGSLNGTYLNRDRIDDGPMASGDEVRIGKFRLTYYPAVEH